MKRSPRLKHRWRRNPEDPSGLFKSGVHWLCSRCGLRRTLSSDSKPAGTAKDRFGLDCPGRVLREVMES